MKSLSFKTIAVTTGLVSLTAIYTLPAWADEGNWKQEPPFQSTKSRDQVRAEYFQALKDGTLPAVGEVGSTYTAVAPPSALTRQAVIADAIEWARVHRGDVMMGGN